MRSFKEKRQQRKPLIGTFIQIESPVITEYLSMHPYDFVLVEAEHSVMSEHGIQSMAQSVKGSDTSFLVRIPSIDERVISKYLDLGIDGMVIPQLRTPEEVQRIENAVYYPPKGKRGIGPGRVHGYGYQLSDMSIQSSNIPPIIIQIETKEAVDNIKELVAFEFVDMLFIGPSDLSLGLGVFGQYDHPLLIETIENIILEAKSHNKGIGIFAPNPEMANYWLSKGIDLIVLNSDIGMLGAMVSQYLSEIKTN